MNEHTGRQSTIGLIPGLRVFFPGYILLMDWGKRGSKGGILRIKPMQIIPPFFIGKFTSDMVMVLAGEYAAENAVSIAEGMLSWKSISGFIVGLLLLCFLLFVDWRCLLEEKKFRMNFRIWR